MAVRGTVIVKKNTPKVLNVSKRALRRAMQETAAEIQVAMRRRVSKAYPPASKPGQFPHYRTGRFKRGINVTGTENGITVASKELHGKFLETGTVKMAARPWAARILREARWRKKILAKAKKYTGGTSRRRSRR